MAITAKRILYFTAGAVATGPEKTAIDKLNAIVGSSFEVHVRNGAIPNQYGVGNLEDADYVAGTIPTAYNDEETYPVADPDAPPAPSVKATQAVVTSGEAVAGVTLVGTAGAGKSMVLTIVAGVITTATFT